MRRLPSGTLVPLSRNTFIAILQPPDPTRVRSGTLCVPRRLVFPFPGTFPHRNVPACPHPGTLRHLFVPRRQQFPSTGTFPHRNVPACPHPGTLRHLFVPRRLVFFVREIRRDHLPLPDSILQRGTAPSKTILFGKEHHTLPNRSPVGVAVPSEFHERNGGIKCLVGKKNPSPIPLQDGFFYHIFVCGRP